MARTKVNVDNLRQGRDSPDVRRLRWKAWRRRCQSMVRMNRDTLFSSAIVDISVGVAVTLPDAAGRYVSMLALYEDRYTNRVLCELGTTASSTIATRRRRSYTSGPPVG